MTVVFFHDVLFVCCIYTLYSSRIKEERRSRLKAMEERAKRGVSPVTSITLSSIDLTYPITAIERGGESDSRQRKG